MLLQVFHICQCYLVPSIQTATVTPVAQPIRRIPFSRRDKVAEKSKEMKKDIKIQSQTFERVVDRKESDIKSLVNDLLEAEEQYLKGHCIEFGVV